MKITKRFIFSSLLIVLLVFGLTIYQTDYYVYTPGSADLLADIVDVNDKYPAEGTFHLVTVSGYQASPLEYIIAKLNRFHEIVPLEDAIPKEITDEEYRTYQLKLMDNSQQSSRYVAYKTAGKNAEIEFNGVFIMRVVKDMPAEGIVEVGDKIIGVDDELITTGNDLINYLQTKVADETIELEIVRDGEHVKKLVRVTSLPNQADKVGIGIQLVNEQKVIVEPEIEFNSGRIGGPSAGLMFALEIYNQLTELDITKGYDIAGTGEIDYDGTVLAIGGIDKKVVAAHKEGIDIFFAPNEEGRADSNYEEAKKTAEIIKTKMKIVPVDTFEEALEYLRLLDLK